MKHIPNILTIIRFLLIPIIIILILSGNYLLGLVVFTISSITDVLDGIIARKFNFTSDFGKLMDPLADKLTQISVLTTLVIKDIIPLWILLVIVIKEFVLISGASFLYGKDVVVYSKWFGKLATVLLYLAIVSSLLLSQFEAQIIAANTLPKFILDIDFNLFCLAIITTIFALVMYIKTLNKQGLIKIPKEENNTKV